MSNPATYRDSTQILLPAETLDGVRHDVERQFTVTVVEQERCVRIIGSPVVIKDVSEFLTRQGVSIP